MAKYRNKKVTYDGIKFDSMREASRYLELKMLEKSGHISNLELQKSFELIPTIKTDVETLRVTKYVCDFFYYDNHRQEFIVEDVKGCVTKEYQLKKKMFLTNYDFTLFENGSKKKYYKKK